MAIYEPAKADPQKQYRDQVRKAEEALAQAREELERAESGVVATPGMELYHSHSPGVSRNKVIVIHASMFREAFHSNPTIAYIASRDSGPYIDGYSSYFDGPQVFGQFQTLDGKPVVGYDGGE